MDQKFPCRTTQYRPGVEDGFVTRYFNPKFPNILWETKIKDELPIEIPFIFDENKHKKLLKRGDWIVEFQDTIMVISDRDFKRIFEQ